jgi:hypothetical protein
MPKRPYELTSASPAEPPRLMHRCRPSSFRKLNSGTFPTSALADSDSGKDMPFRFLDVDAKVDLVRGVAHLVFQNDLNFFFRRVVRLEQAWGHVRRARTSDTEDAWAHWEWTANWLGPQPPSGRKFAAGNSRLRRVIARWSSRPAHRRNCTSTWRTPLCGTNPARA